MTALGPSTSGLPQLSCPFPFLCKECDPAVAMGSKYSSLSLPIVCVIGKGISGAKAHFQQKHGEGCRLFSWLGLGGEKVEPLIEIISSQTNSGGINKVQID